MIILEDDIIPTKSLENIKKDLNTIFWNYPKDSTMIYLEMCYENCSFLNNPQTGLFVKLENPTCAASIFYPDKIRRQKLYNYLKNKNSKLYNDAIDAVFRTLVTKKYINAYILNLLFIQDETFGSDLEGSTGYGKSEKPLLPICQNKNKSLEYIKRDTEIENNIKNKFTKKKFFSWKIGLIILLVIIIFFVIKFLFSKNK
jgi:hypothetical protein